jgi:hypothetical protein
VLSDVHENAAVAGTIAQRNRKYRSQEAEHPRQSQDQSDPVAYLLKTLHSGGSTVPPSPPFGAAEEGCCWDGPNRGGYSL